MSTAAAHAIANATASSGASNATASATSTVNVTVTSTPPPITVYPPPPPPPSSSSDSPSTSSPPSPITVYPPPPPPPPSSSSDSPSTSSPPASKLTGVYVGITVGAVVLALIILCIYCWKRRRVPKDGSNPAPADPSPRIFKYEELERATNGFSTANFLGEGGFGPVHRGHLPNGKEVAVKQLKAGSSQGEREFQAEIETISRVHHRHLVSLDGYCIDDTHRLLVYEFVPNNTLNFHLHGERQPAMEWSTRLKIALGAAKGLLYLHEHCNSKIIHRDIKAANILLDFNFEAKVADFGLARFCPGSHVSTRYGGTCGYVDPEYAMSGRLTEKSDVFSFGVMLLELITGRKPIDSSRDYPFVEWAKPLLARALEDENFDTLKLVDPKLQNAYDHSEMARMVVCAAASICSAEYRPRMSQIVRALEGEAVLGDLKDGIRRGYSTISTYGEPAQPYHGGKRNQ